MATGVHEHGLCSSPFMITMAASTIICTPFICYPPPPRVFVWYNNDWFLRAALVDSYDSKRCQLDMFPGKYEQAFAKPSAGRTLLIEYHSCSVVVCNIQQWLSASWTCFLGNMNIPLWSLQQGNHCWRLHSRQKNGIYENHPSISSPHYLWLIVWQHCCHWQNVDRLRGKRSRSRGSFETAATCHRNLGKMLLLTSSKPPGGGSSPAELTSMAADLAAGWQLSDEIIDSKADN